jgi:oligopeptide/dipeptide ABC transporter ATP-binding protein
MSAPRAGAHGARSHPVDFGTPRSRGIGIRGAGIRYTQGLIGSIPVLGTVKEELAVIPGTVPNLVDLAPGCRFADRCLARVEAGLEVCLHQDPKLAEVEPGHNVRCFLYEESY